MKEISISGKKRQGLGKKATREMRKEALVPCNIYGVKRDGDNKPEALAFAVPATELRKIVYTPNVYIVNIDIDGEARKAVMKELQFHPVTDELLHVDFLEVAEDKPVVVGVPVKLVGLAQGVRDGGRMSLSIRKLNVKATYDKLPDTLDVDVTDLLIGKSIKVGDLNFDGIEIATAKNVVVCSIKMTRQAAMAAQAAANK